MTETVSHHLGIDFGDQNIGLALVRWDGHRNQVLYASTLTVDPTALKKLFTPRVGLRRVRRTKQSKRRRMKRLRAALKSSGLNNEDVDRVAAFCRRRGHSWSKEEEAESGDEARYSVPRAEFFSALEAFLESILRDTEQRQEALRLCRSILDKEIRPKRFHNRRVSKCFWKGCGLNAPKAKNAVDLRLSQAIFGQLRPAFIVPEEYRLDPGPFLDFIRDAGAKGDGVRGDLKDRLKALAKHINEWAREVVEPSEVLRREWDANPERFERIWKYLRKQLRDIITNPPGGRVSYCREHSQAYIDATLAGRVPPRDETVSESDLRSRRQQVVFGKLWRFIEARLLPMAGGRIDHITVERNAFDLVRVPQVRIHEGMSEEQVDRAMGRRRRLARQAEEVYWYGPQYGHESERKMLLAEFGGLCAYCGTNITEATMEREHVLNRADFPLNGYLNLVPACQGCNRRKGDRTALAAGMSINDEAYEALGSYIRQRKEPVHPLMTVKKGILNLLVESSQFLGRYSSRPQDGEATLLNIMGQNLVWATRTAQAPRPLARYLAGKLESATGFRPDVRSMSGRHTAMIREEMLPEFSKPANKEEAASARLANHALDAIILAGQWPSTTALESRHIRAVDIHRWRREVRQRSPDSVDKSGRLQGGSAATTLENFEEATAYGTYSVDLLTTNWNRLDKARFDVLIYSGWGGRNTRRIPATRVVENLRKDGSKVAKSIECIVHPGLRQTLLDSWAASGDLDDLERTLVRWLQRATRAGIEGRPEPRHPADRARWTELKSFCEDPNPEPRHIPAIIGIRWVDLRSYEMVERLSGGRVVHRLEATDNVRQKIVAYKAGRDGLPDRNKHTTFNVYQNDRVKPAEGRKAGLPPITGDNPLSRGRRLGDGQKLSEFKREWEGALASYLAEAAFVEHHRLRQGCVLEYEDGSRRFIRNFRKTADKKGRVGFKPSWCRGIRRVHRSPYVTWALDTSRRAV